MSAGGWDAGRSACGEVMGRRCGGYQAWILGEWELDARLGNVQLMAGAGAGVDSRDDMPSCRFRQGVRIDGAQTKVRWLLLTPGIRVSHNDLHMEDF